MEEDILNYLYQLSCFVGHTVFKFIVECNQPQIIQPFPFQPLTLPRTP